MVIIDIPKSSLETIMTTSFPGYDIKISEATSCPNVKKPYTPGEEESGFDGELPSKQIIHLFWEVTHHLVCK